MPGPGARPPVAVTPGGELPEAGTHQFCPPGGVPRATPDLSLVLPREQSAGEPGKGPGYRRSALGFLWKE